MLPFGVMGDDQSLHLFISNLPREIYSSNGAFGATDPSNTPPPVSDIRRVSYWLVGGEDNPGGLARQEVSLATSDDALQNLPPGVDNENSFIIADEVRSLQFQYWDGTDWQDSWDSTNSGRTASRRSARRWRSPSPSASPRNNPGRRRATSRCGRSATSSSSRPPTE